MGKEFPALTDVHREWIARQHLFFVATAPPSGEGHVNLSPKGYDTFRIVDERTVAYLDLTGSGIETVAHLRATPRLTLMFCAFEGRPRILRLYGAATATLYGDDGFDEAAAPWGPPPGARSVIRLDIDMVRDSCGFAVPLMEYQGERETLGEWAERKGPDGLADYWADRNAVSIDGLPGLA